MKKKGAKVKEKKVADFKIKVQNIVAFTTLGKPIPLEKLLRKVENTEWQPEQFPGLVYKITNPRASALIFSQGKIVCTGTKSEKDLSAAMNKIVSRIRKAGIPMPRMRSVTTFCRKITPVSIPWNIFISASTRSFIISI